MPTPAMVSSRCVWGGTSLVTEEAEETDKLLVLRWKAVSALGIAVGVGMEWNDNIKLSEHNRESDFHLSPGGEHRFRVAASG